MTDRFLDWTTIAELIAKLTADVASAGLPVSIDPDDAEAMAAFEEDALEPEDALDSRFDDKADEGEGA